jgi:shikimate kinase
MGEPQNEQTATAATDAALTRITGFQPDRTIVLVGLMGAGKSAIGRRLAERLGIPFADADTEIETAAGRSIEEIFAEHGEAAFREGERKVIARLLEGPAHVLATGGGAFMDAETRGRIRALGRSVWLKADLDVLLKRVRKRNNRPLLKQGDPREILQRLMTLRYPVYAEADIAVESVEGPHDSVVDAIIDSLAAWPQKPVPQKPVPQKAVPHAEGQEQT